MDTITIRPGAVQGRDAGARPARTALRRPAVAVVLAGGPPHPAFGPGAPRHRPLVPFRGRPIAAWVLDALEGSAVQSVLVAHDPGCDLAPALRAGPRTEFVPLAGSPSPLGESVRHVLEATVRVCGADRIRRSRILILPCDQPFTTAEVIDRVLERADGREFDFAYLAVAEDLLARRWPGRRFRAWSAADLGGRYALQTATLVDGAFLRPMGGRLAFGDWTPEEADRVFDDMSLLRAGRGSPWQVPQFLLELVVRRLARNGGRRLMVSVLARALAGRLRTTDLDRLTAAAFRMRTVCIDSGSPELSADIDTPADAAFHRADHP